MHIEVVDDNTRVITLRVQPDKVVLLQAYFECHEYIGIVRTEDTDTSTVSIITTPDMLETCLRVLEDLGTTIVSA